MGNTGINNLVNYFNNQKTGPGNVQTPPVPPNKPQQPPLGLLTEEQVRDFYVTFTGLILEANNDKEIIDVINEIYKSVLKFYNNGMTDEGYRLMKLILNTTFVSGKIDTISNICNCNTTTGTDIYNGLNNTTCPDLYVKAMGEYLKKMLGDPNFYYGWFFIKDTEGKLVPNIDLVNKLKELINKLLELDLDFSFKIRNDIHCTYDYTKDAIYIDNINILKNYLKVLDYILEECGIDNNKNKIKIYGTEFGGLLPLLKF